MKKYDNYKDSGIEWIGEIPENWEMWKISHAFKRIGSGTTPESGNPLYHENGTINWLNTGDLNDGILNSCNKKVTAKALEDFSSLKIFPAGSLVMAMYGATIGKTSIINFDTTTNQACCVFCKGEIIDVKFLQYWFIGNKEHIINLAIGGGQPNISQNILKDVRVSCPNFNEQQLIANYLDHKTTQIDTLIAKKEQFISLLQEERTAVINQAVTKGLDPNVPMKDSGIEWLGEIPEHWEVKKLKFVSKITRGAILRPVDEPSYFDDNGEWTYLNISDATICDKYLDYGKLRLSELGSTKSARVEPNNLIITASATIGKPFINKIPVCVHDGFIPITELKVNIDFLYNYFKNPQLFNGLGKSNTQKNIYLEDVKNLIIPIPNLEEQLLIARYIEEEIIRIETLISKSLQEIELLKEYKTALISEVVTGKVDVRDVILN
jgi:type I restriction enzyme S subunit